MASKRALKTIRDRCNAAEIEPSTFQATLGRKGKAIDEGMEELYANTDETKYRSNGNLNFSPTLL